MTRRKSSDPPAAASPPSFEEALGELEGIVQAMDSERMPLEEMLAKYERGHQLLQFCQSQMASAQQRIDLITSGRGGLSLQPFPAAGNAAAPAAPADADSRGSSASRPTPPTGEDDLRLL